MTKNKRITLRFTENDYNKILRRAKDNNMNPALYLSERILEDDIINETNRFEHKNLRTLSYCAGSLSAIIYKLFPSEKEQEAVNRAINKIMLKNGIINK